jgi:hypothetical protein
MASGPLMCLLYVSELSMRAPADAVASIARESRNRNFRDGITGLLAFDGWSFLQLVEGPALAIAHLEARLRADKRHRRMTVLALDPVNQRRFPDWRMAYVVLDAGRDDIGTIGRSRGAEALAAFESRLPNLEHAADEAVPR